MRAHLTERPSEAYLAGYFFGRNGRRTERRFDAPGVEIKVYAEGIVDGLRIARASEDGAKPSSTSAASSGRRAGRSTSRNSIEPVLAIVRGAWRLAPHKAKIERSGSRRFSARNRTAGTATPSPMRPRASLTFPRQFVFVREAHHAGRLARR